MIKVDENIQYVTVTYIQAMHTNLTLIPCRKKKCIKVITISYSQCLRNVPQALDSILNVRTLSGLCLQRGRCLPCFCVECVSSHSWNLISANKNIVNLLKHRVNLFFPRLVLEWESAHGPTCAIYGSAFLIHPHVADALSRKDFTRLSSANFVLWFLPTPKAAFSSVVSAFCTKWIGSPHRTPTSGVKIRRCPSTLGTERTPEAGRLSRPHRELRLLFPTACSPWLEAHPPKVSVRTEQRRKLTAAG